MSSITAKPTAHGLAACAVLISFDRASLKAILGLNDSDIMIVLAHPAVEPVNATSNRYRLKPARQPSLFRQLQRTCPRDEYNLHTRAFRYNLNLLRDPGNQVNSSELIAACMHSLRAIYNLNIHYMRWGEMETLIDALIAVAPSLESHDRHQLTLHQAYLAQRRQHNPRCTALVESVLAAPDLRATLRAEALIVRGLNAWSQAQLEAAQSDFRDALTTAKAANDYVIQARALVNQSWIYNQLFSFEDAMDLSRQSLAVYEQIHDRYGTAWAVYSVGNNSLYLGEWGLGEQCLDRAATIFQSANMVARLATVDWGRGFLHQMLGNNERSKRAYLRALQVAESPEHENVVTVADTLLELGLLYHLQGHQAHAEDAFRRAITITERLGNQLSHALLLHRYSQILSHTNAHAALHALTEAIDKLERLRISTQSEGLKIGLLGSAQQVYETMILAQLARGDITTAFAYVERARARAFLDLLAGRGELDELFDGERPVDLAELQVKLSPGSLVLEFFTVGLLSPSGKGLARIPASNKQLREHLLAQPCILLFAITADTVELHKIHCDPNALMPPPGDPAPGWHLLTERKLRWFYDILLMPVMPLLIACETIHIIPHGPLHYLPFAALKAPGGNTLLHQNGPALTYAPSATLLVGSLSQTSPAKGTALAIGYDDRDAAALLLAEREAQQISRIAGGDVVTGSPHKLADLTSRSAQIRWLHIAGHGVYCPDDPMGSFLRLGETEEVTARTIMATLSLPGSLVTLNTCSSGLSHVESGDELLGLPRAFLYAGATTIICTLQQIDDLAAYILMVFFAESLALRASPSAALHLAQLRLRDCHRNDVEMLLAKGFREDERTTLWLMDDYDDYPFAHPRYWAPFILIGHP